MDFFATIFCFILVMTLINRVFDYQKWKTKALSDDERRDEFKAIREDLEWLKEMVADIRLEMDTEYRLPPTRGDEERLKSGSDYD